MKKSRFLRVFLHLFLAFHLTAVLVMPNSSSYWLQDWGKVFIPYGNTFGFFTPWEFFSPNPGNLVTYEIDVLSGQMTEPYKFPQSKEHYIFRQDYNRRIAFNRFTTKYPGVIQNMLGPYLCKKWNIKNRFMLTLVSGIAPSLRQIQEGERLNANTRFQQTPMGIISCPD